MVNIDKCADSPAPKLITKKSINFFKNGDTYD